MASNVSGVAEIVFKPATPLELFHNINIKAARSFVPMSVATIDEEFGVLDRTVVYRGVKDDCLIFVTEKNTRKYDNLKKNPKIAATILYLNVPSVASAVENWQVRLFQAQAVELDESHLDELWSEEPVFARIRSHICECGKPSDREALKAKHNKLLLDYEKGENPLARTSTYTAFKIEARYWDFYMSMPDCIADRVQYRLQDNGTWEILHVDA